MRVEVPLGVLCNICRGLMEAHRVGEACFEEIVVAGGEPLKCVGQAVTLVVGQASVAANLIFNLGAWEES